MKSTKSTLIIGNDNADAYLPGYEITSFFLMAEGENSCVHLGFTQDNDGEEEHISLECEEQLVDVVYNRVCDSIINHPHAIDLRGLKVRVNVHF